MALQGAQEFTTEVAATPQVCFDTIVDFERYPSWSSTVKHARIVERDSEGIGRTVEFRIEIPLKSIRYVLQYDYRRPSKLTWRSVEGDVESIRGSYTFKKLGAKSSNVTCRQEITMGFWVPGPLRRLIEQRALRDSVLEFKEEAERRMAALASTRKRG